MSTAQSYCTEQHKKEQTNLKICTALCMIRQSSMSYTSSNIHTHVYTPWFSFYYSTQLRHISFAAFGTLTILQICFIKLHTTTWTCHCQRFADWMKAIFCQVSSTFLYNEMHFVLLKHFHRMLKYLLQKVVPFHLFTISHHLSFSLVDDSKL